MSKFNYSKQFAKKEVELTKEGPEVTETIEAPVVKPVGEEVKPVEELPRPMSEPAPKRGVVTAKKLNVRKGPSKQLNPVAVIDEGYEVTIIKEMPDWYQVRIAGGIVGYCMAEFITVK